MFKSVNELCNVVSILVQCDLDETYLLVKSNVTNEYCLPYNQCRDNTPWSLMLNEIYRDLFNANISSKQKRYTLRIYKIWIPLTHPTGSIYHIVYGTECELNMKNYTLKHAINQKFRGKLEWFTDVEIIKFCRHSKLSTPEILDFVLLMQQGQNRIEINSNLTNFISKLPDEFNTIDKMVEITSSEVGIPENDKRSNLSQMMNAANFNLNIIYLFFREFLLICFPALFMSRALFLKLMINLNWSRNDLDVLFYAADLQAHNTLSFKNLLVFLAAIDPATVHTGAPANLRARYLFRYFDKDHDGELNYSEFKSCVMAVRAARKDSIDSAAVINETDTTLLDLGIHPNNCHIALSEFLAAIGSLKFRGTSLLFRLSNSVASYIMDVQIREHMDISEKAPKISSGSPFNSTSKLAKFEPEISKIAQDSYYAKYELAVHSIILNRHRGKMISDYIFNINDAVSESQFVLTSISPVKRTNSMELYNDKALPNELLKQLRILITANKSAPPMSQVQTRESLINEIIKKFAWGRVDPIKYGKLLIKAAVQAKSHFMNESRLLVLKSPLYILGDLHGNLADLIDFENLLWHFGPSIEPAKLLFLGDYVDRGLFSTEICAYLFAYKSLLPNKFFCLRGNHEVRYIQCLFSFQTECIVKFGDRLGLDVWNEINNAFDVLPLASIIDTKIFCCHGGIPPPWLCPVVAAINTIPVVLNDPEVQSSLAWDLLWNDPVSLTALTETFLIEIMANEGFCANKRRGTGHLFTVEALERFLTINNLSYLIRAHEMCQNGFKIQHHGKMLTIFSSSHYCGADNEAGCVLICDGKVRVIRLSHD